ncbi:MAG: trypsin-like serine peptidase [Limnospira sp.]
MDTELILTLGLRPFCKQNPSHILCRSANNFINHLSPENIASRIPLNSSELVETIIRRLAGKSQEQVQLSVVFDEPDFLPFRFLEVGLWKGQAVCRIGLKCSRSFAQNFVDGICTSDSEHKTDKFPSITALHLSEILGLSIEQKQDFFGSKDDENLNQILLSNKLLEENYKQELCRKIVDLNFIPLATGFLVGPSHIITVSHALSIMTESHQLDPNLGDYIAQFEYEQDLLGRKIQAVEYKVDQVIAYNNDSLDYALLTLEEKPMNHEKYPDYIQQAGYTYGWIKMLDESMLIYPNIEEHQKFIRHDFLKKETKYMISDETIDDEISRLKSDEPDLVNAFLKSSKAVILQKYQEENPDLDDVKIIRGIFKERAKYGEPVNIIQHPKGRRKEIVISNNWTLLVFDNFITYEADADFSSSGSPVFNQQWQLVALHHGSIIPARSQEGVRICKIVKDLRNQAENGTTSTHLNIRDLKEFVNHFLDENEQQYGYMESRTKPDLSVPPYLNTTRRGNFF